MKQTFRVSSWDEKMKKRNRKFLARLAQGGKCSYIFFSFFVLLLLIDILVIVTY